MKSNQFQNILWAPKSPKILGIFRIVFGTLFLIHFSIYAKTAAFKFFYIDTVFHFKFPGLEFIEPLGTELMMLIYVLDWIAIFFFIVGLFYRFVAVFLFVSTVYLELIDVAYHNNHNYVIILFLLFFSLVGANRSFSIDRIIFKLKEAIPAWHINIFIFQLFVIYFYGSIAKMNYDWLSGNVMQETLSYSFPNKSISWLQKVGFFTTYVGLIFDFLIIPLLLLKKTRWIALVLFLVFNISNAFLFHIGIFPFLMIGSVILFFDNIIIRRELITSQAQSNLRLTRAFLIFYVTFQLIVPFKHFLIPGNVHWTGEGYFISWQMKTFAKKSQIEFMMVDTSNGDKYYIPIDQILLDEQKSRLSYFPFLAKQFADFLEADARSKGIEDVEVYTLFGSSLNGGPLRVVIDQDIDLTKVKINSFGHSPWINLYE